MQTTGLNPLRSKDHDLKSNAARRAAAAATEAGRRRRRVAARGPAERGVIAYLDSSVILRIVLGQPGRLSEWKTITGGVSSGLAEVECLRTINRLRLASKLSVEETARRREAIYRVMEALEVVELTSAVTRRASQPMTAPLG